MVKILPKPLLAALLALSVPVVLVVVLPSVQESMNSKIERQLAAEHLNKAKAACGPGPGCADVELAVGELRVVPYDTPEQAEAEKIQRTIENQRLIEEEKRLKEEEKRLIEQEKRLIQEEKRLIEEEKRFIEEDDGPAILYAAANDLDSRMTPGKLDAKQFDSVAVFARNHPKFHIIPIPLAYNEGLPSDLYRGQEDKFRFVLVSETRKPTVRRVLDSGR
jgi:hypothetical protein